VTPKFGYRHIAKVSQSNIPDYIMPPTFQRICSFCLNFLWPDTSTFSRNCRKV